MANGMKTALLLGTLSGMLLLIGDLAGGQQGMILAFGFAALMNLGSYWFSDKIVLRMYRAQEVGPAHPLYQMTQRLSIQAGLPMPKVYVIPDASPNASPGASTRSTPSASGSTCPSRRCRRV